MKSWPTILVLVTASCLATPAASDPDQDTDTGPDGPDGPDGSADAELGDDGDDDPSNTFVPKNDITPDPDACDPMASECEAGDKCTLVRDENSQFVGRCVPVADETVGVGERCVALDEPGHDNCDADTICWDIMNGEGVCLGFCQGTLDTPTCPDDFICNWGKSTPAGLCTPRCDPLTIDDCPETCGCYWSNSDFMCLPRSSDIPTGEPCGFVNDCAPLNLCVSAELVPDCAGASCCAAYCNISEANTCGPGTSCVAFFEEGYAPPSFEDVGVCVVPGHAP